MSYTKYRTYNLSSMKFKTLNEGLKKIFGCSFDPLDIAGRAPDPGKPIKGGISGERMNSMYRPRFFWAGEQLSIMICDALSSRNNPAYAQEMTFWGSIEQAVRSCGGTRASEGQGLPPGLPPTALG